MARLSNVKRIITEDFESQYQTLISRLGFVLNEFMSDTVNIVNGNIDFDNLTQKKISIDISVNSAGKPLKGADVNVGITNPSGTDVIRVQQLSGTAVYPTSAPFISYTNKGNGIITIDHISGLPANIQYKVTFIVY